MGGFGVPKDREQAVYWFRKAAAQGDIIAQVTLGRCYEHGLGVEKDIKQAIFWYRTAAGKAFVVEKEVARLCLSGTTSPALLVGECDKIQSSLSAARKK
jgi:TPR repeat protein